MYLFNTISKNDKNYLHLQTKILQEQYISLYIMCLSQAVVDNRCDTSIYCSMVEHTLNVK